METWATVALVLGSNIIIGLSTFFATKIQVSHSDRRFSVELQIAQQRELESRQKELRERRREVRSEPLHKLRAELAIMATKLDRLAKAGHSLAVPNTEDQVKEALERATNDWNDYISGDDLQRVLFIQSDEEIVKLVKEIRNDYLEAYDNVVTYREGQSAIEFGKAIRSSEEKIAPKVIQAQDLINKRLEEL